MNNILDDEFEEQFDRTFKLVRDEVDSKTRRFLVETYIPPHHI